MNLKFVCKLLCAAITFSISSCGNSEQKTSTETTMDTTAAATETTTTTTPVNTVVTTPENMMIVINKVSDYNKWLAGFEAHDSMKLANGLHNYVIGRNVEDPNTLLVATKADDVVKAKDFAKSPGLKEAMKKDGVVGTPTIRIVNAVYQDTATIASAKRSMTNFTVKDWDAWKASFDSTRQIRLDNGVMDRVYGYDPDDNHKVTVVVAIIDSAKAIAYWNSDQMKQTRAKAGVTSPPKKFDFMMAKKY